MTDHVKRIVQVVVQRVVCEIADGPDDERDHKPMVYIVGFPTSFSPVSGCAERIKNPCNCQQWAVNRKSRIVRQRQSYDSKEEKTENCKRSDHNMALRGD